MALAYITHKDCSLHDMGRLHPERPARLTAIAERLQSSGLDVRLSHYEAPKASREELERVHSPAYVERIFALAPRKGRVELDPDTNMNPHSLDAALRAAGAGVLAMDLLMSGKAGAAFCAVRPPGHHAERDRAMGFCFFNNIAVAAAHGMAAHGLERIAIVDFDVHHGNGTEDIFRGDPRVLFCSSFQHPWYPHSGAGTASGHILNVPLAAGSGGSELRQAAAERWLPALREQQPQCLLISAGFDGHREDDMAGLRLVEDDYAWLTAELAALAREVCGGRVLSMLEGGYALSALGRSAAAHLKALL